MVTNHNHLLTTFLFIFEGILFIENNIYHIISDVIRDESY